MYTILHSVWMSLFNLVLSICRLYMSICRLLSLLSLASQVCFTVALNLNGNTCLDVSKRLYFDRCQTCCGQGVGHNQHLNRIEC